MLHPIGMRESNASSNAHNTKPQFVRLKCERHRFALLSFSLSLIDHCSESDACCCTRRRGRRRGPDPLVPIVSLISSSIRRWGQTPGSQCPYLLLLQVLDSAPAGAPFNDHLQAQDSAPAGDVLQRLQDRRCGAAGRNRPQGRSAMPFAPDSRNGFQIWTVQEAGLKCPCCGVDTQQWDLVHPMQS